MNLNIQFYTLALILFVFMGLGCTNQATSNEPQGSTQKKVNEDDLVARLSAQLVANPQTQAETDQNLLINYAIDQSLDVQRSSSGLYYQILEPGAGSSPSINSKVSAHYKGQFLDGKVFDSSHKRGKPLEFNLGQVVKGWQEGIPMLKPGGKATLLVPSALAYGPRGYPGLISPNTVLRFDVELIKVY